MGVRYHINPATGRPNLCTAKTPEKCKYFNSKTNIEAPHFSTKTEARKYIEEQLEKEYNLKSIKKENKETKENNNDTSYTTTIPLDNLPMIQERLAKKNKKLKNSGIQEQFEMEISKPYLKEISKGIINENVEMIDIKINKPVISFGGYNIIGSIDKEEGGLIYKNFSNETYTPKLMVCDHCGKKRHRNRTFILKNSNNGEIKQIGSGCVEAYVGIKAPSLWVYEKDNLDDIDENLTDYNSFSHRSVPIKDLLNIALGITNGGKDFVSKRAVEYSGKTSSAEIINNYINNNNGIKNKSEEIITNRIEKYRNSNAADDLIQKIKDSNDDSEWMNNLKTIVNGENVSKKNIGLVVSAVSILKKEDQEKANKISFTKGFAGKIGEKLFAQKVTVVKKITQEVFDPYTYSGRYKERDILTLKNKDGHMLTFFASRKIGVEEGKTVTLKGATVKDHGQFKGIDQTILTRARFDESE